MKRLSVVLLMFFVVTGVCFASPKSEQNKKDFNMILATIQANQSLLILRNRINNQLVSITVDSKITVKEWKEFVALNHKFEMCFRKTLVKYGDQYLKYIDVRPNNEIQYLITLQDSSERDDVTSLPRNTVDLEMIISNLVGKNVEFEQSRWLGAGKIFVAGILAGIALVFFLIGLAVATPMVKEYFFQEERKE